MQAVPQMGITREQFSDLVEKYLLPMFPGAKLDDEHVMDEEHPYAFVAGRSNDQVLLLTPDKRQETRIGMRRNQSFVAQEKRLCEHFISLLSEVWPKFFMAEDGGEQGGNEGEEGPAAEGDDQAHAASPAEDAYQRAVLTAMTRSLVAQTALSRAGLDPGDGGSAATLVFMQQAIEKLEEWSTETYENGRIAYGLGIDVGRHAAGQHAIDVWGKSFGCVLGNGIRTILVCDGEGKVDGLEDLPLTEDAEDDGPFAPLPFCPLARWTDAPGSPRIALALTRNGEILVFCAGEMVFAKRRGSWLHFTHGAVVAAMPCPHNRSPRERIYRTLLDASFSRSGGGIAIAGAGRDDDLSGLVDEKDSFSNQAETKPRFFSSVVSSRRFHNLPRAVRQDLLAVDGSLVLDHVGVVIAVGAILTIEKSSEGGARLAAARAASEHGLGIKVSADGPISMFGQLRNAPADGDLQDTNGEADDPRPAIIEIG